MSSQGSAGNGKGRRNSRAQGIKPGTQATSPSLSSQLKGVAKSTRATRKKDRRKIHNPASLL